MKKILVISFYESTKFQLKGYIDKNLFDIIHLNKEKNEIIGSIDSLIKLNLDYDKYFGVITWADGLNDTLIYFFKKCIYHNLIVLSGQHGINKSILQIYSYTPNRYVDYWNCNGSYMYNRFTEVVKYPASLNRWVALGNLAHQFLYSNFKWDISNVNGKVLIIHEPNLQFAEGDAFPHDSEYIIDELIKYFKIKSIDIDLKVHPNWRTGIGNAGEVLKKFNCNYVDIEVEEIVNYSLVIGSRSSVLYDSYLMGVPVFSIESTSDWKDDEIFFTKLGIIKSYNLENLNAAFIENYNIPYSIDYQLVKSISGDIVNVKLSEEIYNFLKLKHLINHTFGGKVKSYFLPQFRFFYEKFKTLYLRLLIK